MSSKERSSAGIVEFFAIVSLEAEDWALELCDDESVERDESGKNVRFVANRECPSEMGEIIQQHKIIFVSRIANNRRSPNITVQKLKRKQSNL
jgi:hypothetical protein